jgi:hypothetical protein
LIPLRPGLASVVSRLIKRSSKWRDEMSETLCIGHEMLDTVVDPLEQVRAGCARVADEAEQVWIDLERLEEYSGSLSSYRPKSEALDPRYHFADGGPRRLPAFCVSRR